jgi:hypothetical protein
MDRVSIALVCVPVCLVGPELLASSTSTQGTEYDCGESAAWTEAGAIRSVVSDAYAQGEATTADDLDLHLWLQEQRLVADVVCHPEECQTPFPTWDCTPFADVQLGTATGFPNPTLPAYVYVLDNLQMERGCTDCFE